ncbi:hypothetical protein [Nostoc sp. 'Lobaria pulmonaria (5183) cyanobiont']|uniref:hypothetical protein n=1 Tax=Nostoc sp. 'Lobaria pulmonaria (5183) cyanobiont' TaxID=1618022 RepID=UPI000CF30FD2|nr:hypothetical protein [Nostoc sp. 'Lobaria pulmonaria (5183) cyanobiont']AVH72689.1 hypothetical protein NLP_4241 [Nostoc sp. 'Lobaria pulmonaria (5183) cyanobiont']
MNFKHLKQYRLLSSTAILVMGIATLTSLSFLRISQANQANPASTSGVNNQAVYTDRYGFKFSYSPTQFVVVSQSPQSGDTSAVGWIAIWTKQDYQKISGVYEGDYPPNVTISVHRNPQQLSLQKWIQQKDWIVDAKNFQQRTIGGHKGLFFTYRGLYEHENIIFKNPRDNNMILISFAKTNYDTSNDVVYRKAFNEAINSLKLANVAQRRSL